MQGLWPGPLSDGGVGISRARGRCGEVIVMPGSPNQSLAAAATA